MGIKDTQDSQNPLPHYFETWRPEAFGRMTRYQMTLRTFSAGLIRGDVLDIGCGARVYYDISCVTRSYN